MSEPNPYAPPETDPIVADNYNRIQVAGLGDRFLGAFVDGLVAGGVTVLLIGAGILLGFFDSFGGFERAGLATTTLVAFICFIITMAIQWKFLQASGQTIGKKVAKTRIVTLDGNKPEIGELVFKRYAFFNLVSIIPVAGGILSLVNVLWIFGRERRCIHDLIAGTKVVKVFPGEIIV